MSNLVENVIFDKSLNENWHMQFSERVALLYVLERLKPEVSIEIGTFLCGSLRPISRFSHSVYTFDIDPNQHRAGSLFPNVSFVTGDSAETLPPVIEQINASPRELNFILIDGSHEEDGVRRDIINCLRYVPKSRPTVILMHDSSNPSVRRGIETTPWEECPYVHGVNLDFVPGMLFDRVDIRGQIWGGLAAAVLLPQPRSSPIEVHRGFQPSLEAIMSTPMYARLG